MPTKRSPSPNDKAESTRASFQRKVELLELWVSSGVPPGTEWPRAVRALAAWHDEALGIRRWTSPNITSPTGKYADLRARFDHARAALERAGGAVPHQGRLALEIRRLKTINRALARQVVELLQRNGELVMRLRQEQTLRRSDASAIDGELTGTVAAFPAKRTNPGRRKWPDKEDRR